MFTFIIALLSLTIKWQWHHQSIYILPAHISLNKPCLTSICIERECLDSLTLCSSSFLQYVPPLHMHIFLYTCLVRVRTCMIDEGVMLSFSLAFFLSFHSLSLSGDQFFSLSRLRVLFTNISGFFSLSLVYGKEEEEEEKRQNARNFGKWRARKKKKSVTKLSHFSFYFRQLTNRNQWSIFFILSH